MLLAAAGILAAKEGLGSLDAYGVQIQDEALPSAIPDYPVEAQPPAQEPQPLHFEERDLNANDYSFIKHK